MEEVVVIGGGLMGSAAAWELARAGVPVLLLERQGPEYSFGSSFGEARISRNLGPEKDIFAWLQDTSVQETKKLIRFLNDQEGGHAMTDIYTTSPVTYVYHDSRDYLPLLENPDIQVALNPAEAERKFGMNIPDSTVVIREFREFSGTMNPKILISKLHTAIRHAGGRVCHYEKITRLTKQGTYFQIERENTQAGEVSTIVCKQVIAAAGPYNGTLLRETAPYVHKLIRQVRLFMAFLDINTATYDRLTPGEKTRISEYYPVADISQEIFYSMIEQFREDGRPLLKVGGHLLRTEIEDTEKAWHQELAMHEIEWSIRHTAGYLKTIGLKIREDQLEFVSGYSCIYSLTPDEIPYVTQLLVNGKVNPDILLVGGMSGIGAKGALAYGQLAADLLLGRSSPEEMYQKTRTALGLEHLKEGIQGLETNIQKEYRWH